MKMFLVSRVFVLIIVLVSHSHAFHRWLHRVDSFPTILNYNARIKHSLDDLYLRSLRLKCPFFRRRASDIIDGMATIWKFLVARHKSLPSFDPPGCMPIGENTKWKNLPISDIVELLIRDWGCEGKGYYITGRLTKEIYRNDCLFDGPDPDMPVRGLRKYLSSASQLFDRKKSKAEIYDVSVNEERNEITVSWRIEGILNLPWHPYVKPWTGTTTYLLDSNNLVYSHIESWDISVVDAFLSVVFPDLGYGAPPAPPLRSKFEFIHHSERVSPADSNGSRSNIFDENL